MPVTRPGSVESSRRPMTPLRFARTPGAPFQASVCTSRRPTSCPSGLTRPPRSLLPPRSMPTAYRSGGTGGRGEEDGGGAVGASGLLVVVLLLRRRRVVLELVHALLELLDARAQRAGQVRQTLRAEQNEDDDEDDQQLLITQTKHDETPFLILKPPYRTRPAGSCQRVGTRYPAVDRLLGLSGLAGRLDAWRLCTLPAGWREVSSCEAAPRHSS